MFRQQKAKRWAKRIIARNLKAKKPIDCEQYIHPLDRSALVALKKIPLLDILCSKIIAVMNDKQQNLINMSRKIHITEKQIPKIFNMVKSICHKIGIDMPELYLQLDREPNAVVYGTEKFTIVINSGLLECFEDDEIYAVLAHECGHIACKHGLYHTVGGLVLNGSSIGLHELGNRLNQNGVLGKVIGNLVNAIDSTLELALYKWSRCSELSADRVAVICCGGAEPVIETMMRLAGGTTHIDSEVNRELFLQQATDYQRDVAEKKIDKALEFLLTKDDTHPLLSIRAYEAQQFAQSDEFKKLMLL